MKNSFRLIVSTGAGPHKSKWILSPTVAAHSSSLTFCITFRCPFPHSHDAQNDGLLSKSNSTPCTKPFSTNFLTASCPTCPNHLCSSSINNTSTTHAANSECGENVRYSPFCFGTWPRSTRELL